MDPLAENRHALPSFWPFEVDTELADPPRPRESVEAACSLIQPEGQAGAAAWMPYDLLLVPNGLV